MQQSRPKLIAVDIGTFCDNRLMDDALVHLHSTHDIIYVVDRKRTLPLAARLRSSAYLFDTPTEVTGTGSSSNAEIDISMMDTKYSALVWGLMNPLTSYSAYSWVTRMSQLVIEAVNTHSPVGIVFHYAATMLLWQLPSSILDKLPLFIIYHAPGLISRNVPWVFDNALKDPSFVLYEQTKAYETSCMNTWYSYYNKLSMNIISQLNPQTLRSKLLKVHHVFCWDKTVTMPIIPAYKGLRVHQPGALYTPTYKLARWYNPKAQNENDAPPTLYAWLKQASTDNQPVVLVSFGSYSAITIIKQLQQFILRSLLKCGAKVLYHAPNEALANEFTDSEDLKVHNGWLPYEWIVPHCATVVFTGSACLQSVCNYNAVPMIYVPLLSEQFFWARNYKAMTGTSYINYLDNTDDVIMNTMRGCLIDALSVRTQKYLKTCSNSMKANNGSRGVAKLITQITSN